MLLQFLPENGSYQVEFRIVGFFKDSGVGASCLYFLNLALILCKPELVSLSHWVPLRCGGRRKEEDCVESGEMSLLSW